VAGPEAAEAPAWRPGRPVRRAPRGQCSSCSRGAHGGDMDAGDDRGMDRDADADANRRPRWAADRRPEEEAGGGSRGDRGTGVEGGPAGEESSSYPLHHILYFTVQYFRILRSTRPLNSSSKSTTTIILLYFLQLNYSLSFPSQLPSNSFNLTYNWQ
jgi:hypothetical protein